MTCMNASRRISTSHIEYVTHMNESCLTYTPHIIEPYRIQLTLQHKLQRTQHVIHVSNKTHTATHTATNITHTATHTATNIPYTATHTASNRTCSTEDSSQHHKQAMSKITLTSHVEENIKEPCQRRQSHVSLDVSHSTLNSSWHSS